MRGASRMVLLAGCVTAALFTAGCVLPAFKKVPGTDAGPMTTSTVPGKACGLSDKLPQTCDACIRKSCCDLAKACGSGTACGKDLLKPITPLATLSESFDPLLDCMQQNCDDACHVSWGCVDNYSWTTPQPSYDITVTVDDFAAEPPMPLPGVTVNACQSVDPACKSGKVSGAVTDDKGEAKLTLTSRFEGFFDFSGGGYTSSTAQFSEPLYQVAGFRQYQLTDGAIQFLAVTTGVHKTVDEKFDPSLGHIIFRAQNCLPPRYLDRDNPPHAEAAGVHVSVDPNENASPVFYTDKSGGVSLSQDATSSTGLGGAFGFPAHNLTVTATDAATSRKVATGTVVVRPATIGFIYLVPSSKQ